MWDLRLEILRRAFDICGSNNLADQELKFSQETDMAYIFQRT